MKLPPSFNFKAHLPGMGVVTLSVDLTSTDPSRAEVESVEVYGEQWAIPLDVEPTARVLAVKALGLVVGELRSANADDLAIRNAVAKVRAAEDALSVLCRYDSPEDERTPLRDQSRLEWTDIPDAEKMAERLAEARVATAVERMQKAMADEAERQAKADCFCSAEAAPGRHFADCHATTVTP